RFILSAIWNGSDLTLKKSRSRPLSYGIPVILFSLSSLPLLSAVRQSLLLLPSRPPERLSSWTDKLRTGSTPPANLQVLFIRSTLPAPITDPPQSTAPSG